MQYEHTTTQIPLYWNIQNQITFGIKSFKFYGPAIWNVLSVHIKTAVNLNAFKYFIKTWKAFHATASTALISGSFSIMCIAKPCTHLHPAPSTSIQHISTSTQLHPPPPSSFQAPPSSLQHSQQYLNQNIACNWIISLNLGQKIKNCPFWLKIYTHGILEVLIPNPDVELWNSDPKIHFWANSGLKI